MINNIYLKKSTLEKFREIFQDNNPKGIQITSFMELDSYQQFLKRISSPSFQKKEVRDMYSFFEAKPKAMKFFSSSEFISFASKITEKKLKKAECSLRMFMKGCYTLVHEETSKPGLEFFFDLTSKWNDSFGGYIAYLSYDGGKVITPQHPNTLILAESGRSYVKYVNSNAKSDGKMLVYGKIK